MTKLVNRGGYTKDTAAAFRSGILIDGDIPVPSEFVKRAGLGYDVNKCQSAMISADGTVIPIDKRFNLVRSDDGHLLSPDAVSDRYSACRPVDMAEILDYFAREGFGRMDFARTLYDGTSEIVCLKLDFGQDIAVPNDPSAYNNFLVFQNFHDGNGIRYRVIRYRFNCANAMRGGLCDGVIRHTGNIEEKLAFARNTWTAAREVIRQHSEKLGLLMNIPTAVNVTVDKLLDIDRSSGKPVHANGKEVSTQKINLAERIVSAARNPLNYGTKPETFGAIYQGITWLNSHFAGGKGNKTADKRLESILSGTAGSFDNEAWDFLTAEAGIA